MTTRKVTDDDQAIRDGGPGKDDCNFDVDTKGTVGTNDDVLDTIVGCEVRWANQTGPLIIPQDEFLAIYVYGGPF